MRHSALLSSEGEMVNDYPCSHEYLHYIDSQGRSRCGECLRPLMITARGIAVIESGLTVRQAHEIETGCTDADPCDNCRRYLT